MCRGFSTRRGRPRVPRPTCDHGTPELAAKKQACLTSEPIDWLYAKQLITESELWCAMHFRWLYRLRHGAVTLQARDLNYAGGYHPPVDTEPDWRIRRSLQYREAAEVLQQAGLLKPVLNIGVFGIYSDKAASTQSTSIRKLKEGLELLNAMWNRKAYCALPTIAETSL